MHFYNAMIKVMRRANQIYAKQQQKVNFFIYKKSGKILEAYSEDPHPSFFSEAELEKIFITKASTLAWFYQSKVFKDISP